MLKYFIMIVTCHGKLAIANHTSTTTGGINVDMYGMVNTYQIGSRDQNNKQRVTYLGSKHYLRMNYSNWSNYE